MPTDQEHDFTRGKPLLWGKHCRGAGCDDYNEQRPSCACECYACTQPSAERARLLSALRAVPVDELAIALRDDAVSWAGALEADKQEDRAAVERVRRHLLAALTDGAAISDDGDAPAARLEARHRLLLTECAQCSASLHEPDSPPHCTDCHVDDDHREQWGAALRALDALPSDAAKETT